MEAKILAYLKENKHNFVSGEEICRKLKVSRTAVWKHIRNLKENGYEVLAQPHFGYRLVKVPDRMLVDEITYKLSTKSFGKKVVAYKSTSSTNARAYTLAEQSAVEGTLVISEEQTQGKGRLGRSWNSPKGKGIYASLILRPKITPAEAGKLTLMSSVSVAKTIRRFTGAEALIKWPNDVLINDEKVCGILTEMSAEQDLVKFIILGIGVNVNTDKDELPKGATSLKLKLKKHVSRLDFLKNLLHELELQYIKIKNRGFGVIVDEWRSFSLSLGRRVKVKWRGVLIEGQAMDVDDNGALIIRDDFGFSHHILSGDVRIIR